MDQEHAPNPYGDPTASAVTPEPPGRPRRMSRIAVTVGLTSFLGLAGAGVAFAVGGSSSTPAASSGTTSTTTPAEPGPGGHRPGGFGAFGGMGGIGGFGGLGPGGLRAGGAVVHGEYTVKSGTGYKTVEVQTGTVQAVSSTSITVSSADGYSHTYAVATTTVVDSQAGGISTVARGDTVQLQATTSSGKDTATDIVDTTKVKSSRSGFGFGGPDGGRMAPAGGPAGTAPATGGASSAA